MRGRLHLVTALSRPPEQATRAEKVACGLLLLAILLAVSVRW